MKSKTKRLRALFRRHQIFVAPAVYDSLGAKLVERAGFEAVYISGFTLAASMGLPDVGLTTLTEVVRRAATIVDAVGIPVMCDAETGFGGYLNVGRMVREFEKAGIAGLKFEDQITPPNRAGRPLLPLGEIVSKIKAAVDARVDPSFMVMARTDAAPTAGLRAAITRCRAFERAGADVTHALDVPTVRDMKKLVRSLVRPTIGVISLPHPPILSVRQLAEIGHRMVIVSVPIQFTAVHAMLGALEELKATGSIRKAASGTMMSNAFANDLVGFNAAQQLERHYQALAET